MVTKSNSNTTSRVLPTWAQRLVTEDDCRRIEGKIAAAELMTSGEIVPILVRRSATIGHVWIVLTLMMLIAFMAIEQVVAIQYPNTSLIVLLPAPFVLAALAWTLSSHDAVQRLLTPPSDLEAQVLRRAELEFFAGGLQKTAGSTGILIFVSLMERRAVVLADASIANKLPADTWKDVIEALLTSIKRGQAASGFETAIESCGRIAAEHFPLQPGDVNEIQNIFVVKD